MLPVRDEREIVFPARGERLCFLARGERLCYLQEVRDCVSCKR